MIEIPEELYDIVAEACLYRGNPVQDIASYMNRELRRKISIKEATQVYHDILKQPDFKDRMKSYLALEKATVIDDDEDTILLQYNRIIREATKDGKYEVVARVLDKIRQIKAIDDKQIDFNITFTFKPTDVINLEMLKSKKNE